MIILQNEQYDGSILEVVLIDNEDGSQVSMLKSTYEAMQAEQSTPIVTADE